MSLIPAVLPKTEATKLGSYARLFRLPGYNQSILARVVTSVEEALTFGGIAVSENADMREAIVYVGETAREVVARGYLTHEWALAARIVSRENPMAAALRTNAPFSIVEWKWRHGSTTIERTMYYCAVVSKADFGFGISAKRARIGIPAPWSGAIPAAAWTKVPLGSATEWQALTDSLEVATKMQVDQFVGVRQVPWSRSFKQEVTVQKDALFTNGKVQKYIDRALEQELATFEDYRPHFNLLTYAVGTWAGVSRSPFMFNPVINGEGSSFLRAQDLGSYDAANVRFIAGMPPTTTTVVATDPGTSTVTGANKGRNFVGGTLVWDYHFGMAIAAEGMTSLMPLLTFPKDSPALVFNGFGGIPSVATWKTGALNVFNWPFDNLVPAFIDAFDIRPFMEPTMPLLYYDTAGVRKPINATVPLAALLKDPAGSYKVYDVAQSFTDPAAQSGNGAEVIHSLPAAERWPADMVADLTALAARVYKRAEVLLRDEQ